MTESNKLNKIREQINTLDANLIKLLEERKTLCEQVITQKIQDNLDLRDKNREFELLQNRIEQGKTHGLSPHFVTKIFHEILEDSLRSQGDYLQRKLNQEITLNQPVRIAYHGSNHSYCYLAAEQHFSSSKNCELSGYSSFDLLIKALTDGTANYAVLPIENTAVGAYSEVYELLLSNNLFIVGEEKITLDHAILAVGGTKLEDIKKIIASPQAVQECRKFINQIPNVEIQSTADSAQAAKLVSQLNDKSIAAIASRRAASTYNLEAIAENITTHKQLFMRYVVVSTKALKVDLRIPCKTSLILATANKAGSLADVLQVFKVHQINMTKLESRPVANDVWQQMFYLDFEGNFADPEIKKALDELSLHTKFIKYLGSYPTVDIEATQVLTANTEKLKTKETKPVTTASLADNFLNNERVQAEKKGYKLSSRGFHIEDTVIDIAGIKIGGTGFVVMAGPCSVESETQIMDCAKHAKESGAVILRGGCFKPRTSPYSFQGMGFNGLDLLVSAGSAYGMPTITEVMAFEDIDGVAAKADIIQIGARNMQNYSLLKAIGKTRRPVMLKRGLSAPIEELLQAAEYLLAEGNHQVMLCERGIRTFETQTRSTLDISAIPVLKRKSHLPIIIDPSHAAGDRDLVIPLALAAKAAGAHGIIVEFHPEPEKALSDGPQALRFGQLTQMMQLLEKVPSY